MSKNFEIVGNREILFVIETIAREKDIAEKMKEEEEKAQQKLCDYFYSLFEEPDNKKNEHNKEL